MAGGGPRGEAPGGERRASQLERLLSPSSVAVVGASERPGWGRTTLENLRAIGYGGSVCAVNPRYEEVASFPCYPSIEALPSVPDAAVFAIPAGSVPGAVAEAVSSGVGAGVVYASGFGEPGRGEGGEPGAGSPQARLRELSAGGEIALLGPNCLGMVNYAARTAMFGISMTYQHAGTPEGVALFAQSGNMGLTLSLANRGVRLTHFVSCGNQLDVTAAELIAASVRDQAVRCVALVLEGIPDVGRFSAALGEAAERDVPVVVLKVGESEAGRRATVAHTGTLAGSSELYRSFFRQHGAIQVADLDEMIATCAVMSSPRRPSRRGVVVFASSGGECGLVSDLADAAGVTLPALPDEVAGTLSALLPEYGSVANPLDITAGGWGDEALYSEIVAHLGRVDGVGSIVSVADAPTLDRSGLHEGFRGIISGLGLGAERVVPNGQMVALLSSIGDLHPDVAPELAERGVVPLCGLRPGLSALAHAAWLAAWRERCRERTAGSDRPREEPGTRRSVSEMLEKLAAGALDEATSKDLVARYGIATPPRRIVGRAEEAADAAEELGFPVVLKLSAESLQHKSDVGGVLVGLRSGPEVETAARRLLSLPAATEGTTARLLVERHVEGGLELLLGGGRAEPFGPTVTVGIGGVMTEVLSDAVHRLAPIGVEEALVMLSELRGSRLLDGFRGEAGFEKRELAEAVSRLSRLVAEHERIVELDLNPVVRERGRGGLVALDALVVLG